MKNIGCGSVTVSYDIFICRIEEIIGEAGTVLWSGPLGAVELEEFQGGTRDLVDGLTSITSQGALTVVAGASSAVWARKFGAGQSLSCFLPAGPATRQMLAGVIPPGMEAVDNKP